MKKIKNKEKLIITLWTAQIQNLQPSQSLYCRLIYDKQQHNSKLIPSSKSLAWKQTFVFKLGKKNQKLRIDIINMQDDQQIHFAKDLVLDSLSLGKSTLFINMDNSNRGTYPAKLPIIDNQENKIGILFIQFQIIKTQVISIFSTLMDYQFMIQMYDFRMTFTRDLQSIPFFYIKFIYGNKSHKEDFSFQRQNSNFKYSYPIKIYIKDQQKLEIQIQMKANHQFSKKNFQDQFLKENIKKKNKKKKNQIDLSSAQKLYSLLELSYKKDAIGHRKIPLNMQVNGKQREIGNLQFDIQIFFKSKQQKKQLQVHRKQIQDKKKPKIIDPDKKQVKKQVKKYEAPKNGKIIVNSIIAKLQISNDDIIRGKNLSIQLKLGKNQQVSTILEDPGKQLIWIDTFTFSRTWQQTIKFVVSVHNFDNKPIPSYYTQINLRDLFQLGRYMAKKLQLKDDNLNYSGSLTIDMTYREEQQRKQKKNKIIIIQKTPEQILQQKKQKKRKQILQRMKIRLQQKKQKQLDMISQYPTFSQRQLQLPPLRRKSLQNKTILSGKRSVNMSVNMYNQGGIQRFNKSPRFQVKKQKPIQFCYSPSSDFELNKKKGVSIGHGQKSNFTKLGQNSPGVGRYHIPSVWDKYKYK